MKDFSKNYYDYTSTCPFAVEIEGLMNDCGSPKSHLKKLVKWFEDRNRTPREMFEFICACIGYWSETKYYDDRNKYAVFGSRTIAEHFPYVKTYCKNEDLLLNAFGFTMSAHRYLQNEFFKTILEYFKNKGDSLYLWWDENDFVYGDDKLIPYAVVRGY